MVVHIDTVLQTIQRPELLDAAYRTVHYKEHLKSLDKGRYRAGFVLSRYCHNVHQVKAHRFTRHKIGNTPPPPLMKVNGSD